MFLNVEIPKPGVPDGKDIEGGVDKVGDSILGLDPVYMKIIVAVVVASIIMYLLKNPLVRGMVIGGLLIMVVYLYATN